MPAFAIVKIFLYLCALAIFVDKSQGVPTLPACKGKYLMEPMDNSTCRLEEKKFRERKHKMYFSNIGQYLNHEREHIIIHSYDCDGTAGSFEWKFIRREMGNIFKYDDKMQANTLKVNIDETVPYAVEKFDLGAYMCYQPTSKDLLLMISPNKVHKALGTYLFITDTQKEPAIAHHLDLLMDISPKSSWVKNTLSEQDMLDLTVDHFSIENMYDLTHKVTDIFRKIGTENNVKEYNFFETSAITNLRSYSLSTFYVKDIRLKCGQNHLISHVTDYYQIPKSKLSNAQRTDIFKISPTDLMIIDLAQTAFIGLDGKSKELEGKDLSETYAIHYEKSKDFYYVPTSYSLFDAARDQKFKGGTSVFVRIDFFLPCKSPRMSLEDLKDFTDDLEGLSFEANNEANEMALSKESSLEDKFSHAALKDNLFIVREMGLAGALSVNLSDYYRNGLPDSAENDASQHAVIALKEGTQDHELKCGARNIQDDSCTHDGPYVGDDAIWWFQPKANLTRSIIRAGDTENFIIKANCNLVLKKLEKRQEGKYACFERVRDSQGAHKSLVRRRTFHIQVERQYSNLPMSGEKYIQGFIVLIIFSGVTLVIALFFACVYEKLLNAFEESLAKEENFVDTLTNCTFFKCCRKDTKLDKMMGSKPNAKADVSYSSSSSS